MCGIAGLLTTPPNFSAEKLGEIADKMGTSLRHRGPDDHGTWVDAGAGVALAHRRLSIVDLSAAGHQPMVSADGRYVIIYNGEVYNHQAIRPELEAKGHTFQSHSDTEVILQAISEWGVEPTIKRLIGMFAIGLWDRRDRTLTLVRDRLGIKPIYWTKSGNIFLFGSELKALRAYKEFRPAISKAAVASYMRHNYVPAPHTIYEGVFKLQPGTILTLPWQGNPTLTRYWDARAIAVNGLANPFHGSDHEATEELEALLLDSVKRRMIADVPLGAFLSGGIDSSTVVAMMQSANTGPVRTFTIGFSEPGYDEAPYAASVARHLGTDHTEMTVSPQQALAVIPKLSDFYDEPFADSSQIPTYLVSAMTREHVTVALSGDGGDELFAGYNRYHLATKLWRNLTLLPFSIRHTLARGLTAVSPDTWTRLFAAIPRRMRPSQAGDKIHKLASILSMRDPAALYRRLVTHWNPADVVPHAAEFKGILWDEELATDFPDLLARMQLLDLVTYLPDDILTKVDRASMAVALEARVPLIDHRVVEFAWRLPRQMKIRDGKSKWLLRQVLYRHVPSALIERPKMGFGIPLDEWLRGPLRDWAENLLSEQRLGESGLLEASLVRRYWQEHLSGQRNWQYPLWCALMLEAWRERWA